MKVLLFGATGSAGGSVLQACLAAPDVEEVRAITRRPLDLAHERLRVYTHADFTDYAPVAEAFAGVDACLFCLGVSATQVSAEEYRRVTHDFTLAAARTFKEQSPGAAFHYITGMGTRPDSRMKWAQVKAQVERELMDLVGAVCWRPAYIDGARPPGGLAIYKILPPILRLLRPFRSLYVHGHDLGRAMLQATRQGMRSRTVENPEIRELGAVH